MRKGDFSVEVIPHGRGNVRELDSGQVLARPGQVYRLRLRNHGPLHAVVHAELDGRGITAGGLVLAPWSATELERPIDAHEDGRFTVVAEGDETVFGPDGGRDNESLGLIAATFRRELPNQGRPSVELPPSLHTTRPTGTRPMPGVPTFTSRIPEAFRSPSRFAGDAIERAAGTGLTGHSDQEFVPFSLGRLEDEATTIALRLVIGSEAAIDEAQSRPAEQAAPERPAARP